MDNMESGRRFRHTIELILRREKNWVSGESKDDPSARSDLT